MMAVSCGTPTPATMRVVQIEPGPMPTLTASAPASISALAPSAVAMLPATTCTRVGQLLDAVRPRRARAASGRGRCRPRPGRTPAVDQPLGAGEAVVADVVAAATRSRPCSSLAGMGIGLRLLDVLDRDQADAAVASSTTSSFSMRCWCSSRLASSGIDAFAHRDQPSLVISSRDRLARIGGKAHVAVGENADQLPPALPLDHRNAGDAVAPPSAAAHRPGSRRERW